MRSINFRPLTGLCLLAAAVLVVIAVIYFTRTAGALPAFFPGHQAGSTHHHTKHGIAVLVVAGFALIAAWFTTAPAKG